MTHTIIKFFFKLRDILHQTFSNKLKTISFCAIIILKFKCDLQSLEVSSANHRIAGSLFFGYLNQRFMNG